MEWGVRSHRSVNSTPKGRLEYFRTEVGTSTKSQSHMTSGSRSSCGQYVGLKGREVLARPRFSTAHQIWQPQWHAPSSWALHPTAKSGLHLHVAAMTAYTAFLLCKAWHPFSTWPGQNKLAVALSGQSSLDFVFFCYLVGPSDAEWYGVYRPNASSHVLVPNRIIQVLTDAHVHKIRVNKEQKNGRV
jgi:hypothetical protein